MLDRRAKRQAVFLPENEPYLGRPSVYNFDRVIPSCLRANQAVMVYVRQGQLSDLQSAASQLISQGINLALSIRELVRQGYLFGALVLLRPLIERTAIVSYLYTNPDEIATWNAGWPSGRRPSLARMIDTMTGQADLAEAKKLCETFGHIVHGDPASATWNLVQLPDGALGHAVSKSLDEPDLCDFICYQACSYCIVLMGNMAACFPDAPWPDATRAAAMEDR